LRGPGLNLKETLKSYLAILEPVPEGGYFVRFPDIENALTQGATWEEAFEMATDVLALCLSELPKWPRASKAEKVAAELGEGEAMLSIPVDDRLVFQYQPKERVNVSLPKDFLAKIDGYRASTGQGRSELLAEGGKLYMEQHPVRA